MSIALDQILSSQRGKINKPYPIFLSFIPKTQRTFLPIWHICPFSYHFFCQITQFSLSSLFSSALHASFLLLLPCSQRRICPRRKTSPISKTPKQENSTQYTPRLIPSSCPHPRHTDHRSFLFTGCSNPYCAPSFRINRGAHLIDRKCL